MHNLESVQQNETHGRPWAFEIQTDHLISARRPELVIINKKIPVDLFGGIKVKEGEKRDN